jgi:hypothetical protein
LLCTGYRGQAHQDGDSAKRYDGMSTEPSFRLSVKEMSYFESLPLAG